MKTKALRKTLEYRDADDLRDEIVMLYKKFDLVQQYYDLRLQSDQAETISEKYKKILDKQFCPTKGEPELKYSIARKAISDFKKVCDDPLAIIDLELTYVEYGVKCSLEYGDIDERFYQSMESMFQRVLEDMEKENVLDLYESRCQWISKKTANMGWGFGDAIEYLYDKYFSTSVC